MGVWGKGKGEVIREERYKAWGRHGAGSREGEGAGVCVCGVKGRGGVGRCLVLRWHIIVPDLCAHFPCVGVVPAKCLHQIPGIVGKFIKSNNNLIIITHAK